MARRTAALDKEAKHAQSGASSSKRKHDLQNTLIYLIGYSGTGKYTIAKEISRRLKVVIIDNHTN